MRNRRVRDRGRSLSAAALSVVALGGWSTALAAAEPAVWCVDASTKVMREQAAPAVPDDVARLAAAKNDYEAVQIVVRPQGADLHGLTATADALTGPDGATLPATNISILQVYYHHVTRPSDAAGQAGWWPDALPPLDKPIDVAVGVNQPLWVLVHIPTDAAAGDYTGRVHLRAQGFSTDVPVALHVWNFALPSRNHLQTSLGLDFDYVLSYHQAKSEEDQRRLLDLYFQSYAAHRMSPCDPVPLDSYEVKFHPDAQPPRATIDFSAFDAAMTTAVTRYHFTGINVPLQGMGAGNTYGRKEPGIGRYGEKTPQYQAMFASAVGQIEQHLRQKGWLDMAYVYWFDEPAARDYPFVRAGMERLKKYAPGLPRMLTKEPSTAMAGAVDIWCSLTSKYDAAVAAQRRARGERFWWYVCCEPTAPYCTEAIDHPGLELRVWLWQTWQRRLDGILIWETNYWTSGAAYPEQAQNPYADPMSYGSGEGTPPGQMEYWGNGDGRFLYPPPAAAAPGQSGAGPVLAPPVSSIRWEMLREGIEDYEFHWLLRDLLDQNRASLPAADVAKYEALLDVPAEITRDMTTFTTDATPLYARRAALARAIEQLAH